MKYKKNNTINTQGFFFYVKESRGMFLGMLILALDR